MGICWVSFQLLFHSDCCYRMAEPSGVVVEVVGWGGIDPLPELPFFHSTAEDSFSGSLYIFGEPAIFSLEGWSAFMRFHRGDDEAPTQEAPVMARSRSFLVRYYGGDWEALVLSESGEVLLFKLREILVGWLGLVEEQREEFALAMDNWPQIVFGRVLDPWQKILPAPGLRRSCGRGYPPTSVSSYYACTNPLRGKCSVVLGLHIPKFVRRKHCKI